MTGLPPRNPPVPHVHPQSGPDEKLDTSATVVVIRHSWAAARTAAVVEEMESMGVGQVTDMVSGFRGQAETVADVGVLRLALCQAWRRSPRARVLHLLSLHFAGMDAGRAPNAARSAWM